MYRPGLNDLDAVIAIARKGSFRAAALDLGMSTTALSNAVGKLEANLGVRLFNRTTRSVSLTDAGRVFVEQVGPALQDIHGAMEAVRSQQATPSGTLRINAFATAAREILSPLVLEFLRRYPQVHVDLVTEGRLVDIVAEGFDLGVRVADLVPSDMIAVSLGRPQRYAVVGSPAYFEKHGRPRVPPDLLDHPCIRVRLPNGALYRWQFEKARADGTDRCQRADHAGRGQPRTDRRAGRHRARLLHGAGRACRHRGGTPRSRAGGLDTAVAGLCLYYPGRRNPSAALKAFIGLARDLSAKSGW